MATKKEVQPKVDKINYEVKAELDEGFRGHDHPTDHYVFPEHAKVHRAVPLPFISGGFYIAKGAAVPDTLTISIKKKEE